MVKEYMKKSGMEKLFDEYMKKIQAGDTKAINEIGLIFQNNYDNENAKKWFLKAIEAGDYECANNLGYLYASQHDFENAEKQQWIAIENEDYDALNNLSKAFLDNSINFNSSA